MSNMLACLPADLCPGCGSALTLTSWAQPTLFIGLGHGGTTESTVRQCRGCGWSLGPDIATTNPRPIRTAQARLRVPVG